MADEIDSDLLKLLQSVDTPTVCNAIEVAQGKRGFSQFTRGTMLCSIPDGGAIVGFAKTAKIAAIEPPKENPEIIKERRMNYYRYMSEINGPTVVVIEDLDFPNCIGAYWGEINTKVHKANIFIAFLIFALGELSLVSLSSNAIKLTQVLITSIGCAFFGIFLISLNICFESFLSDLSCLINFLSWFLFGSSPLRTR